MLEDGVDAVGESHVEHLVGLVEHHVAYVVELHLATLHEVYETSWRGHDDLCPMPQLVDLSHDGRASIHGYDVHVRDVLGKRVEVVCNLQAQLTRWAQDESLRVSCIGVGSLQHGNAVRGGLASASLRQRDHVVVLTQQIRNDFLLDGHRLLESKFFNGVADRLAHAQFFKCLQKNIAI